jgi:small subunit ribosomal protein S16
LNGAQPTDTAAAILSYKGASYKKHLQVGVRKGAISQEEADKRFNQWLSEKEARIQAKRDGLSDAAAKKKAEDFKAETKRKEDIAARIAAKAADAIAAESATEEGAEETASEETAEGAAEEATTSEE